MPRRVLMVTPHFPPDTMAATHRVRLLAPYLGEYGWQPIVLTIDPSGYEHQLDEALMTLVPRDLRVVRCRALSPRWTRRVGLGDLGLRAFIPALRTASSLIDRERVDAVFITTYPIYTAALGPLLKRRYRIPFVIDVQDPWVGAWGRTVGGGANGAPDLKSRASRQLARAIEPAVFRGADAITAVSERTIDDIRSRVPAARHTPAAEIPLGGDARDFAEIANSAHRQTYFDPADGLVHVCAVGTLLPLGIEVASAVFAALARLRASRPDIANRLRLHFFGTSNERRDDAADRALPLARAAGVADLVTEHARRIDYVEAVRVQLDASALLLLGSSEPHYTASKLYPALLARRPLLAVYHEASPVTAVLRAHTRPPTVHAISFDDRDPVTARIDRIAAALEAIATNPTYRESDVDPTALTEHSARALAGRLADVLSRVA